MQYSKDTMSQGRSKRSEVIEERKKTRSRSKVKSLEGVNQGMMLFNLHLKVTLVTTVENSKEPPLKSKNRATI